MLSCPCLNRFLSLKAPPLAAGIFYSIDAFVCSWSVLRVFTISATPAEAHPPREHDRRLRALVTRVLADAARAGLTVDEVVAALHTYGQGGQS